MHSVQTNHKNELCSICISPLNDPCVIKYCEHRFCRECIESYFNFTEGSCHCPCCRGALSPYSTIHIETGKPLKTSDVNSIFGLVFVQLGRVGVASYHFLSPNYCYISYENAPRIWHIDDGSKMPKTKPFDDIHYDHESRTFTARVVWTPQTVAGAAEWKYEMVFDEGFRSIVGGEVRLYNENGSLVRINHFGADLMYRRQVTTIFGSTYVQAGVLGLASYHFNSLHDCYISYARSLETWKLDDGSRPPVRKYFTNTSFDPETRTFKGTIEWDVPFVTEIRWEYTMVFSSNYEFIVDGMVTSFRTDGSNGVNNYPNDLKYRIYYPPSQNETNSPSSSIWRRLHDALMHGRLGMNS